MVAYLVYSIFPTFVFDELSPTQDISLYFPVQFHYTQFWKHKFSKNIQFIHDYFLAPVLLSMIGKLPGRISSAARDFLLGKGEITSWTIIHSFTFLVSRGHLSFLLRFVTYKLFVYEVCRQCSEWPTIFELRKKKHFITIPFDLAEI